MIKRETYLNQLLPFIDKPFIKVLTGLRRCGKSSLLMMLEDELIHRGVLQKSIIRINFESFDYTHLQTSKDLYDFVKKKLTKNKKTYILLDEIQEVKEWEKAVNAFLVDFDVDIYITGSNSRLLSSELSTYIAGRFVEFHIQTLSFKEYLSFNLIQNSQEISVYEAFENYRRLGGFPVLHTSNYSYDSAYKVVFDIYSSAILRDTIQRNNIRDIELLERIVKYVFDNIGNKFSAKNVADYFKSQQRKLDLNTVYNYLKALEYAFIIYRIPRYDVKGKEILKTQEKYFVGDIALLYSVMGFKDRLISGVLENILMLELKHRGYNVYVGKFGLKEIDFIAEKSGSKIYVQVAYLLTEPSTIEREFSPLLEVKDNFPKYVVTMDAGWKDTMEGIKHFHIADFLLLNSFD